MYFKQLELFGFKSFAQKTSLQLEPGVSAIVGPNGCGKSNIGDAVRWVLGEQKMRVLRGQHMEDIIFNGSDDRHPLGMAEVTLVLDNSDARLPLEYTEVSITRRLFRSGESEYYLNKLPCRRKDVVELFMGTGVGPDSYSLIEQGRIDLVLSSKPEERRYIFEDAAGIIKYKSRKDAALRKLERADANLLRLQDTIIEVRRQINALKRQVNAAQRYRETRDELRRLELRLALVRYRQLDGERSELLNRARELNNQVAELEKKQADEEARINSARSELYTVDRALSTAQEQVRERQSKIERAETTIALLREKISALDELEKRSSREIDDLGQLKENLTASHQAAGEKECEALQQAVQAKGALDVKEAALTALNRQLTDCESRLEQMRSLSVEKLNRKMSLQNELRTAETNLQEFEKRKVKIYEQKRQVEQNLTQCDNRLSETRNLTHSLRAALASLSSDIDTLAGNIIAKEQELEESIHAHDCARDSLSAARSKMASLEELRDKFEGYEDGVRAVMLAKQQADPQAAGVVGTLADLFHGKREHEAALEAALGHRLQHIVVENLESAARCARLLEENAGQASFIPLSLFGTNGHEAPLERNEGEVDWASNLVDCEERLRSLANALLGQTLVVDSFERALAAVSARESNGKPANGQSSNGKWNGADLVTLSGEAVSSIGIISAGSRGQGRGLLGRKNEIDELRHLIERLSAEAEQSARSINELKQELESMRGRLQELNASVHARKIELTKAEADAQQLNESKRRLEQERDVLGKESHLAEEEIKALAVRRGELMELGEQARNAETEVAGQLQDAGSLLGDLRNQKEALNAEITQCKVTVSSLQHNCQTLKHELARLMKELEEADRKIGEKRIQLSEARETSTRHAAEIDSTRSEIQRIHEEKRGLDQELRKCEEQKTRVQNELDLVENTLRHTRHVAQELGDQRHQVEINLAQVSEKIAHVKEKTVSDYRLSISEVAQEIIVEDAFDSQAASEEAQRLRAKIESMGPVNLIAIEEFEEHQHRYDFLIQQEGDLRKAKEALLGIVKKINETTQVMFLETFEQVREHFHEIFRHLFGGGRAHVALMDPAAPLESGIEISVHPPGKKPLSISSLSGGEKALTAIALLFAIFKTKPSPFCLLDEVDAPLDDNNILRFARLVKMFSESVQFILVTHNKRSMELADVLYGVTMEEKGVSQIVSVKLTKPQTPAFEFLEPTVA
jgi:chromosome segregation protein